MTQLDIQVPLRRPAELMAPEALARLQPTRLSFSRALVNRMAREAWQVERTEWVMDERGNGRAQYRVRTGTHTFSFVIISNEPTMEARSSRIIGGAWDMLGALIDGDATEEQVAITRREIPKLYSGRAAPDTLVWCRANRSLRAFDHAVDALAAGRQPDLDALAPVGYLFRNTGLDANGTFGTRSYLAYPDGHPLRTPYFPQMCSAYLAREFAADLADHIAATRSPDAVRLSPAIKSYLGLGNGSGLGLVLWVHNHPQLLDAWLGMREEALARARALDAVAFGALRPRLDAMLQRAITYFDQDRMVYEQFTDSRLVAANLRTARAELAALPDVPAEAYCSRLAEVIGASALESVHALLIECLGEDVDPLLERAVASELPDADPLQSVAELAALVRDEYAWALAVDLDAPGAENQIWYKSRDAEEPRRGPVDEVPPGTVDLALALPALLQRLDALLATTPATTVGEFLAAHPELRWIVERVQSLAGRPFHTPHANVHDDAFVPVHLIRLMNVAVYGIDKTRDYLGRNLRGLMFHGAPPRELLAGGGSDWFWPVRPDAPERVR
ncbi:MAG TPA: hypothetical protein VHC23_03355 [Jatrophihabitans sp.]|nr:hypothetical protein [Jatrophihabitans sp.]